MQIPLNIPCAQCLRDGEVEAAHTITDGEARCMGHLVFGAPPDSAAELLAASERVTEVRNRLYEQSTVEGLPEDEYQPLAQLLASTSRFLDRALDRVQATAEREADMSDAERTQIFP